MLRKVGLCLLSSSILFFTGCGSSSDSQSTKNIAIEFSAKANNKAVTCTNSSNAANTYSLGSTNNSANIVDFRFFVSDIYLISTNGQKEKINLDQNNFQYEGKEGNIALLDFEDNTGQCQNRGNTSEINKSIKGKIKEQEYNKIEFTLGVPFDLNHIEPNEEASNTQLTVLKQPGMGWNWQTGKKFAKIELEPTSSSLPRWNFHLGSTDCKYDNDVNKNKITSCTQANRIKVTLDFDYKNENIIVNLDKLLESTDISQDNSGAAGCMGSLADSQCTQILPKLAINVVEEKGLCVNGNDCSTQELFTVESK